MPIVFTDVTPDDLQRLKPPPDVTGAVRIVEGQRTVSLALDLRPDTRQVVIVSGASPFDRGAAMFARGLVEARAKGLTVLSLDGQPLEEQLRRVAELPEDSVVIFTSYRADTSGRLTVAREILQLVARASNAPTFGAADAWLGYGIVGGDLYQYDRPRRTGCRPHRAAPQRRVRLVAGTHRRARERADVRLARAAAMGHRRGPAAGGEHRPLSRADGLVRYRWQISGALALLVGQGLGIAALLFERRSRRRAQTGLAEAEERYRTVADFTADWEFWKRPDGSFAYVSPSCLAITGYNAAAFLDRPALLTDMILPEDQRDPGRPPSAAQSTASPGSAEFRIRTRGGEVRWIEHVCSPVIGQDGQDLGTRGSNRDITSRKQSEEELRHALGEISQLRDRLEIDNAYLRELLHPDIGIEGLIGTSDVMRYVVSKVQQVAPTRARCCSSARPGSGRALSRRPFTA